MCLSLDDRNRCCMPGFTCVYYFATLNFVRLSRLLRAPQTEKGNVTARKFSVIFVTVAPCDKYTFYL